MGASKACPNCRAKWDLAFKFCPEDGTPLLLHQEEHTAPRPAVVVEDDWFDELDPNFVDGLSVTADEHPAVPNEAPAVESFRNAPTVMVMPAISQQFIQAITPPKRIRTGDTPKVERELAHVRGSVALPDVASPSASKALSSDEDEPWPEVSEGPARFGRKSQYEETILQHQALVLPKDHPLYQAPKSPKIPEVSASSPQADDMPSVIVAPDLLADAKPKLPPEAPKPRSSGLFWFRSGEGNKTR